MKIFFIEIKSQILAFLRIVRRKRLVWGKSDYLSYGKCLHLGANVRLWAPNQIKIGDNVYIGKDTHIECNTEIGDNSLIANRVSFVGRNDHDYSVVGLPIRFSPWIGNESRKVNELTESTKVIIDQDVWVGFGCIILSGVRIGRGAILAAGSVVTNDIEPYAIAAGIPAKKIKSRFNKEQVNDHELAIDKGFFHYSAKGLKYSEIHPYKTD